MTDATEAPAPKILSTYEAAPHFGACVNTIIKLCKGGKIPGAFRVGNRWRIPEHAIDQFKKANGGGVK